METIIDPASDGLDATSIKQTMRAAIGATHATDIAAVHQATATIQKSKNLI